MGMKTAMQLKAMKNALKGPGPKPSAGEGERVHNGTRSVKTKKR